MRRCMVCQNAVPSTVARRLQRYQHGGEHTCIYSADFSEIRRPDKCILRWCAAVRVDVTAIGRISHNCKNQTLRQTWRAFVVFWESQSSAWRGNATWRGIASKATRQPAAPQHPIGSANRASNLPINAYCGGTHNAAALVQEPFLWEPNWRLGPILYIYSI